MEFKNALEIGNGIGLCTVEEVISSIKDNKINVKTYEFLKFWDCLMSCTGFTSKTKICRVISFLEKYRIVME